MSERTKQIIQSSKKCQWQCSPCLRTHTQTTFVSVIIALIINPSLSLSPNWRPHAKITSVIGSRYHRHDFASTTAFSVKNRQLLTHSTLSPTSTKRIKSSLYTFLQLALPKRGTQQRWSHLSASKAAAAATEGKDELPSNKNGDGRDDNAAATSTTQLEDVTVADEMLRLRRKNRKLEAKIKLLEDENERLARQHNQYRVVIETFEGENRRVLDDEGHVVPRWFEDLDDDDDEEEDTNGGTDTVIGLPSFGQRVSREDECTPSEASGDICPVEPDITFQAALRDRAYWLVGLLALQSCSGIILARNEMLLQNHPVIVYFLTMLVGAGGNAGNQASVRVIRGLALGSLNENTIGQFLSREFKMSVALSAVISLAGFCRAAVFHTPFPETVAVTAALALIVFSSVCLGAVLPLFLKRLGVDPAHSSTTIQVIMDILGVVLTVLVSAAILDSGLGEMIVTRLSGG